MKNMMRVLCVLAMCGGVSIAQAEGKADKSKPTTPVSKEDREKMAAVHEKMAACLRSDKSFDVCHDEMKAAHEKGEGCPMMGDHEGMKHHHHAEK